MTTRRADIVDYRNPGYYHCISRCVRRESLLREPRRREWLLQRLEFLAQHLAIEVVAFAVMENHLHLLLRTRPDAVEGMNDQEVARRRLAVTREQRAQGGRLGTSSTHDHVSETRRLRSLLSSATGMASARRQLSDLGFFHKLLKEPCARRWNTEDEVTGHFWEGRYRSLRVLDPDSLIRVANYIDLNQVRAHSAGSIASSLWTSARTHWTRFRNGLQRQLSRGPESAEAIVSAIRSIPWKPVLSMVPTELPARPPFGGNGPGSSHEFDLPLVGYLELLDRRGRKARHDKSGFIRPAAPSPIDEAVSDALRRCARTVREAVATQLRDAVALLRQPVDFHGEPSRAAISHRGSCYGSRDSLEAEAQRRGTRRVIGAPLDWA